MERFHLPSQGPYPHYNICCWRVFEHKLDSFFTHRSCLYIRSWGVLNITILPAIASGIDSSLSSYMWQIPSTLPKYEFYDLQITLDSDHSFFQRALAPFNVTIPTQASAPVQKQA
ncbi:hypothetical protein GQ44DRAFT_266447 [Phaeosphaeriaceae sp. PMI808]|nr:hypothetical protein GQ44DRAFT_266447 [Phaeosphaeriaceae sp. PMI808]